MWTLIQIELFKIFRRPRTYLAFAAITGLIGVIQLGLKIDGDAYVNFIMRDINSSLTVEGKILNGYQVCYIILQALLVHVPLLISLVAADMSSGEANMGTLRIMLTKPISRTNVLLAKFSATFIYTFLLLVWLAVMALFLNMLIFGTDDLFLLKSQYVVLLKKNDIFWRYIGAFGFAVIAMTTVAALGFFLSLFAENSIGPIIATMSIIIFFTILSTLSSIPLFNAIKPYLFTTHMISWKEFFDVKVNESNEAIVGSIQDAGKIVKSAVILLLHIAGFVTAGILVFRKKDVLS